MLNAFKVNDQSKKARDFPPHLLLSFLKITIEKKPKRPILSLLVSQYLALNPSKETKREIEVIIKAYDQDVKMTKPQLLTSILLTSKNRTSNLKNNKTIAKSSAITIRS